MKPLLGSDNSDTTSKRSVNMCNLLPIDSGCVGKCRRLTEALFIGFLNNNMSIFRLHYRVTIFILTIFALLNIFKNLLGTPITCISDSSLDYIIDSYCSNVPTHIIPDSIMTDQPGNKSESNVTYYNQSHRWILFMLVFQAILFYIPHYFVKMSEGDLMDTIFNRNSTAGQHSPSPDQHQLNEEEQNQSNLNHKKRIVDYFVSNLNGKSNRMYAYTYIICEVLNFLNTILQICMTNYFFIGNENHFANILNLFKNPRIRVDPLERSLPQSTKCTFYKLGPGGRTVEFDSECILAVNSTNQLTIALLSYWFLILAVLSMLALLSRLTVRLKPQIRKEILRDLSTPKDKQIDIIFRECEYGDWFLLSQLRKYCDSETYRGFIQELGRKITD